MEKICNSGQTLFMPRLRQTIKLEDRKMTNAQIDLKSAIRNLENGKLDTLFTQFIESIRDYDKKDLRSLTSREYKMLVKAAR